MARDDLTESRFHDGTMTDDANLRRRTVLWQDPAGFEEPIRRLSGIEFMRAFLAGDLPPPPFMQLLGVRIVSVDPSSVVFEFEPAEYMVQPTGERPRRDHHGATGHCDGVFVSYDLTGWDGLHDARAQGQLPEAGHRKRGHDASRRPCHSRWFSSSHGGRSTSGFRQAIVRSCDLNPDDSPSKRKVSRLPCPTLLSLGRQTGCAGWKEDASLTSSASHLDAAPLAPPRRWLYRQLCGFRSAERVTEGQ